MRFYQGRFDLAKIGRLPHFDEPKFEISAVKRDIHI
jgi:hypothetical protein